MADVATAILPPPGDLATQHGQELGREQVHRVPNLAQYWGTCDTSSNKDMVLPGDLWDWPNLEPQVPGRGSLRLHKLDRPPNSIPVFFLKSSSLAHSPAPSGS